MGVLNFITFSQALPGVTCRLESVNAIGLGDRPVSRIQVQNRYVTDLAAVASAAIVRFLPNSVA